MRLTKPVTAALTGLALTTLLITAQTMEARDTVSQKPPVTVCGSDAECAAQEAADAGITEEDPRWNCLTMGNLTCGPDYIILPAEKYLAIFEDTHPIWDDPTAYCLWAPDATTTVVCSDGTVVTS
jgi:hypothetical protein